jgi:iron complex transport system substrate-binding protein
MQFKWHWSLLLLFCWGVLSASEIPAQRIVSTNLCTDQLLMMLAEPERITSISYLALEPDSSYMHKEAAGYKINHAEVEELLALKPDLIVAGSFTQENMIRLMRKLGYQVEVFNPTSSIEGIRINIRRMAKLLGREMRGEEVINQMDQRIKKATERSFGEPQPALFYQPRGYTSGSNTVQNEALEMTGWRNVSAEHGIVGYGNIDLETVVLAKPRQFFTSAYTPGTNSLAQRQLNHPALNRISNGRPMINIDYRYWICGGPMIAEAIEILAEIRSR